MEFDLIDRYFKTPFAQLLAPNGNSVVAGIGDDCAALRPSPNHTLYVSTDTLVEGVHFFKDDDPYTVGWKSLACNLSDLSACGAAPLGFTLNLSLPAVDAQWLDSFSAGMLKLAVQENCPLVGGDTTSAGNNSSKTLSITVFGQAPATHKGFHRSHGQAGDDVWVSGTPGLARLGLLLAYEQRDLLNQCVEKSELARVRSLLKALPSQLKKSASSAFVRPCPRVALGIGLRGLANACIDLSDGLSGDLTHITKASGLSAHLLAEVLHELWLEKWPDLEGLPQAAELFETLLWITLEGGDDFELCWTASSVNRDAIQSLSPSAHCIGSVESGKGVWLCKSGFEKSLIAVSSYNHFPDSER